ncbi:MAG TPA: polymer-forming cytoskeletal protein [Polyangia bacterium]|jgi:cytoskeletal protein CcmA (bactofilin family)|nr:polymer-forming cytoskeletal protein [Polyangia bacterium]
MPHKTTLTPPPSLATPATSTTPTATIIGEHVRIRGTIEGDEDLVVQGLVEGSVRISGALVIEPAGQVFADVVARDVTVNGLLRGNVTASSHIEVTRSGRMSGDAIAPAVSIAVGATFRGRVEMGDARMLEAVPVERRALPREAAPHGLGGGERRALPREGVSGDLTFSAPEAALAAPPAPPQAEAAPPPPPAPMPRERASAAMSRPQPPPPPAPEPAPAPPVAPARRTVPPLSRPRSGRMQRREMP